MPSETQAFKAIRLLICLNLNWLHRRFATPLSPRELNDETYATGLMILDTMKRGCGCSRRHAPPNRLERNYWLAVRCCERDHHFTFRDLVRSNHLPSPQPMCRPIGDQELHAEVQGAGCTAQVRFDGEQHDWLTDALHAGLQHAYPNGWLPLMDAIEPSRPMQGWHCGEGQSLDHIRREFAAWFFTAEFQEPQWEQVGCHRRTQAGPLMTWSQFLNRAATGDSLLPQVGDFPDSIMFPLVDLNGRRLDHGRMLRCRGCWRRAGTWRDSDGHPCRWCAEEQMAPPPRTELVPWLFLAGTRELAPAWRCQDVNCDNYWYAPCQNCPRCGGPHNPRPSAVWRPIS